MPCSRRKIWDSEPELGPVPAAAAYTGTFYRLARAYAEEFADRWVILSALHGFLDPDDPVPGPYDVTFRRPRDPRCVSVRRLRKQVEEKGLTQYDAVSAICGRDYVTRIQGAFEDTGIEILTPLKGIGGIGSIQKWLKQAVSSRV